MARVLVVFCAMALVGSVFLGAIFLGLIQHNAKYSTSQETIVSAPYSEAAQDLDRGKAPQATSRKKSNLVADEVRARFKTLGAQVGVEYRKKNTSGEIIVLKDKSFAEDGVYGRSYFFSNGDRYVAEIDGYAKEHGFAQPPPPRAEIYKAGEGTLRMRRTQSINGKMVSTSLEIFDGRTIINGRDYTGRIPRGVTISIEDGLILVDGKPLPK